MVAVKGRKIFNKKSYISK